MLTFLPGVSVKDYCHGRGSRLETGTWESFRLERHLNLPTCFESENWSILVWHQHHQLESLEHDLRPTFSDPTNFTGCFTETIQVWAQHGLRQSHEAILVAILSTYLKCPVHPDCFIGLKVVSHTMSYDARGKRPLDVAPFVSAWVIWFWMRRCSARKGYGRSWYLKLSKLCFPRVLPLKTAPKFMVNSHYSSCLWLEFRSVGSLKTHEDTI